MPQVPLWPQEAWGCKGHRTAIYRKAHKKFVTCSGSHYVSGIRD